ncbi:hypothetical protein BD769DRAFT_1663987 [Suillus cothurnatus]|nr:hypothetical protein BD769DRAFT_1663987 [Suillus cothurnatus]
MLTPSNDCPGDHIQDLRNLLQGMTLSDSSFDTITWSRKTTEESITLSRSLLLQSMPTSMPIPPSTTAHLHRLVHPPTATPSMPSHPQPQDLQTATQTPCEVTSVPKPSEIQPLRADEIPEGFWAIIVGQEVGVFYQWADVADRTNFVSSNVQKGYQSFQQALTTYTAKYNEGRVRAVPLPGGPFWPSSPESSPDPPSPTVSAGSSMSSDSYDLWSQVEDLTETMSQL